MQKSQLDAKPYGMGELITQRKILAVPEHQRSFSWAPEDVEQFIEDIHTAFSINAVDYFVGVIVLQTGINNEWVILDGQQRLTTSTIFYAAMRDWLIARGFKDDSQQLESEFIGVRQLGGTYSSRLTLNSENKELFQKFVLNGSSDAEIQAAIDILPKKSTNRQLLEALKLSRKWLSDQTYAIKTREEQSKFIFDLALYLEKRVKVVCVDVSSESDAYVIFEALNDRGVDLSALDLVKNHIYSHASNHEMDSIRDYWKVLKENIEGKDADDFLKIFWTSRFGVIQKVDLFRKISEAYPDAAAVVNLAKELSEASEKVKAIEDLQHELWTNLGDSARVRMFKLNLLGSKQLRSVILSAFSRFSSDEISSLLSLLIVLIVRYQLIGRERTGVLEKVLGKIAESIWSGTADSALSCQKILNSIIPSDESFSSKLATHLEKKPSRVAYLLMELESFDLFDGGNNDECLQFFGDNFSKSSVDFILPKLDGDDENGYHRIGNRVLLEYGLLREARGMSLIEKQNKLYANSMFKETQNVASIGALFDIEVVDSRSKSIAEKAINIWNSTSTFRV